MKPAVMLRCVILGGLCLGALGVAEPASALEDDSRVLVAHLPSSAVEAAARQAEAITTLASYLSESVPGVEIRPEIFRRATDAAAFLEREGAHVALMLSEAPFVAAPPPGIEMRPAWRSLREGRSTFRKILVVPSGSTVERLGDLRGATLTVVEAVPGGGAESLGRQVFDGEIDPASWFGSIEAVADDFTALANVLYGRTDAALVAEYNPLLARHLGGELRSVFESPPLSLPVLSLLGAPLDEAQRAALGEALAAAATRQEVRSALSTLGWEGFTPLSPEELRGGGSSERQSGLSLSLAVPGASAFTAGDPPPAPLEGALPFALAVELPELPLDPEALGLEPPSPGGR
jgi:ABC-type phosphate/phosphonate transport system substrate-binding protein